jgi:hypothetical protein
MAGGRPGLISSSSGREEITMSSKTSGECHMDDGELRKRVLEELEFEPSIDAAHIGVAAENGIVTLSGHVGSYVEKFEVERAVRRIKGVTAVAEELEVRYPSDKKTADDEIAARAVIFSGGMACCLGKRCE